MCKLIYYTTNKMETNGVSVVATDNINENHLLLANYCQNVYLDSYLENVEEYVNRESTDVQCVILKDPNEERLIVCFRGSDDLTDWRMNFNLKTSKYPLNSTREVHSGFLVQWLSVKDEVQEKIGKMIEKYGTTKITFCGHSAGAGACCLATYDLGEDLMKSGQDVNVVSFGSPKICNQDFKDYFNDKFKGKSTRIVLDMDAITVFPLGYHHVCDKLLHMTDKGIQKTEPSLWQRFTWFASGILKLDFGIRDHLIFNYTDEIKKICNK